MTHIKQKPQRLSSPSGPGSLLKHLTELKTRTRIKDITERNPVYLSLVRQLPCIKCGIDYKSIAAHVRMQSAAHGKRGGTGKKPPDRWCLPICEWDHTMDKNSQHRVGERHFWNDLNLNPLLICERLYEARSDIKAMRTIILDAIAESELQPQIHQRNGDRAGLSNSLPSRDPK